MIQLLKNIFGMGPKVDLKELMKKGAQIIDVRTKDEFQGGHIRGSVNIPLQNLKDQKRQTGYYLLCFGHAKRFGKINSEIKRVYRSAQWRRLDEFAE